MNHSYVRFVRALCWSGAVPLLAAAAVSLGCSAAGDSLGFEGTPPGGGGGAAGATAQDGAPQDGLQEGVLPDGVTADGKDAAGDGKDVATEAKDAPADGKDTSIDGPSDVSVEGGDAPLDAVDVTIENCSMNPEICDGLDNNCNGAKDEGDPGGDQDCDVPNKLGECKKGTTHCQSAQIKCVQNTPASAEICDGKDNNCDGVVDNNTTDSGGNCNTGKQGVCAAGTEKCVGGQIVCQQNLQSSNEVCNGLDDDCNGTVDDGFPGAGQPCTVPNQPPNTPCAQGQTNCFGGQNGCSQTVFPSPEICDGKDNDCNGTIDDPSVVEGKVCDSGLGGECAAGKTQCTGGSSKCVPNVQPGTQVEVCNSKDDDCNGTKDDVTNIKLECATKFPNAQNVIDWRCTVGTCEVMACAGAFKDCDSAPANGCEVNTLSDLSHCSQCGKMCSASHGTPSCVFGVCNILCDQLWGNCDGNADNGCEKTLAGDVSNCGGCGKQCESSTGTPSCTNGVCGISCNPGLGNCDSSIVNGCETNLTNDPNHCGSCTKTCSSVGGTPSCVLGLCGISCAPGRADCNNNVTDGCEIDTESSVTHCGSCSKVCSSTNGTPTCANSICGINCTAGYGNCDNNADTGCEVNLLSNASHCNGCGNACNGTNGTPSCTGGVCGINCTAGFGNCDNNVTNGCETDLKTDPDHCGSCPKVCNSTNGTPTCTNSVCGINCSPGFGDCDSNAANGCETNLKTDVGHCGTCAKVCSTVNGTPTCSNGTCGINCAAGFGNCDSNADTGCEVNLNSNPSHCNGCGNACNSTNGTATCTSGICGINCTPPFSNCDGNLSNGCEVNLSNDKTHCGSCTKVCSTVHGTATCSNSQCSISCDPNWGNCDTNVDTGCEADLKNDAQHCGNCTTVCSPSGGTPSCNNGQCGITCSPGYGDCDGNVGNGCETYINTNVLHCGGCGHACSTVNGTPSCSNGTCGIACTAPYLNCDSNVDNGCEVNGNTDTTHCGSCSKVCNSTNGTATCTSGACGINCNGGYANCNGNPDDGCEINLNTDVTHCGSCPKVCSNFNGTPGCSGGACSINCSAGWGNCDSNVDNGCETNTTNNVLHCSGCGAACSTNHATPSCVSSACQLSCAGGWGNCDGNVGNGCEQDLTGDPDHCGTCTKVCNGTNGTRGCSSGTCTIVCNAGFANCDGNPDNGCEVNLTNDPTHCGTCTKVCNGTNGTPFCLGGACGINCTSPWASCDGNVDNGCEINTSNDVSHCGGCNQPCSNNHGTPSCSNSVCSIACTSPWGNCNGAVSDGCETDTSSTVAHCGACNANCNTSPPAHVTGASCSGSSCRVASCESLWYDQDSTWSTGCECNADNVPNACGSAVDLGSVAVNGTLNRSNNLSPNGDEDWFKITFLTDGTCNFNPRISLQAGSLPIRIQVYTACGGGGVGCSEGGDSTKAGLTTWEFTYQATCGYYQPIDPIPATGTFIGGTMPSPVTFYVRVYPTGSDTSCLSYTLNFTN
jgi:hypothetical protein